MNILECKNLIKEYALQDNSVKAVNGISLKFSKGEFCAITGPSGSGKSTLLHLLSSLDRPTQGQVFYAEKDLSSYNDNQLSILRRRRFGFVFQNYNLVSELTAYENIILPIMLEKKKPDEKYLSRIIEILGLSERLEHFPSALSGGQMQRVAIARAIANRPSILFADEPTGNLDSKSSREVISLLKYISREYGVTLILVTHDLAVAQQADRILRLEDGKIVLDSEGETK